MPFVRPLYGFSPPRRTDGLPFITAQIQESALENSGFTTIDTKTLDPVDPDPAIPLVRDFTTDDATLEAAWYRVRWIDQAGAVFTGHAVYYDASSPADPLDIDWRPTIPDVAVLERGRTYDRDSNQVGTFNATTTPTGEEVEQLISKATSTVAAWLGRTEFNSEPTKQRAQDLASIYTAMLIEVSYFPEQAQSDDSAYERFSDLFQTGMRELTEAVGDTEGTRKGLYSIPMRSDTVDFFA